MGFLKVAFGEYHDVDGYRRDWRRNNRLKTCDTKIAWDIVRQVIAAGHTFSVRNMTTGTMTTQAELASKARGYVAEQLAEATFQQFISLFENFFFELLRRWLLAYPRSLSGRKLDFQAVLDSPDKDAITLAAIAKT